MKTLLYSLAILATISCKKTEATEVNASLMEVLPESDLVASKPMTEQLKKTANLDTKSEDKTIIIKKIIKNGDITIDVADIKSAQNKVQKSIKDNKGYIQNERYSNSETETSITMEIRIPNENFDNMVDSFSDEIGTISQKNIRVQDVTEEYTDVSIRLKNKLVYLEKYRDLLKRSASTKDLLEIQEKIRGLEEEIESSEGKLRFIDDQVNYSTLNLTLNKEKPRNAVTSKIGFGSRFIDSLANGWNIFITFFLGIISLWPFALIIPIFIYLLKKWRKRKSKKD